MELIKTCSNRSEIIELLSKYGIGYRSHDDPIFTESNKFEQPFKKLGIYSVLPEEDFHIKNAVSCNVPNCLKDFDTIFGYESHYNSCHRHLCHQCTKNLPSAHLLDMHLSEKHDSFFAVQSKTKPMYVCYVQECIVVCMTPEERKDHCINVHKYPHNFRFDLMPKKKSAKQSGDVAESKDFLMDGDLDGVDSPMEEKNTDNSESVSNTLSTTRTERTQKVLKTINFGHSQPKVFNSDTNYAKALTKNQSKSKSKTQILDDNKMIVDLMSSLPE